MAVSQIVVDFADRFVGGGFRPLAFLLLPHLVVFAICHRCDLFVRHPAYRTRYDSNLTSRNSLMFLSPPSFLATAARGEGVLRLSG